MTSAQDAVLLPISSEPPLVLARLVHNGEGVPVSDVYGDIYHSASGARVQAEYVFLAGNNLPKRWQGQRCFTILETGFGLGLNFLSTWAAWQSDAQRCDRLHFISFEKHPFAIADLVSAQAAWPELAALAYALQQSWPPLEPGEHRVELAAGQVILHLIFGDATECLPRLFAGQRGLNLRIDAFYLDGFSPAHNPELWSPEFCRDLARQAADEASLSTWSVAGSVRRALDGAGFTVRKSPGFGSKRQTLRAWYAGGAWR